MGDLAVPIRLDTVPPRWDAWSRGCDASAGTFQEGWQRCGGPGAARRKRPRLLAPARPGQRFRRGSTLPVDGGGQAPGGDAADSGKPKASKGSGPGSRIALRNWRISTRLVSLLALPVVAATTLGGMRIGTSLDNIDQLDKMQLLTEMTRQATELADALQTERDKSAGPLAGSGNAKDDANVVAPRGDRPRPAVVQPGHR